MRRETVPAAGVPVQRCPTNRVSRRGVVLIVVLVLVAMLALAGFAFMQRMATEYEATRMSGDLSQAEQVLASAETYLLVLAEKWAPYPEPENRLLHDANLYTAQAVRPVSGAAAGDGFPGPPSGSRREESDREWQFVVVRSLPLTHPRTRADEDVFESFDTPRGGESAALSEGETAPLPRPEFGLTCESARLHPGRVLMWENNRPGAGREALLQIPGMTSAAADAILNRMRIRPGNTERASQEFRLPMTADVTAPGTMSVRGTRLQSLEELLAVPGVSRSAFYGMEEQPDENADVRSAAWSEYLTVTSAEPNVDRFGRPRIRINRIDPVTWTGRASGDRNGNLSLPEDLVTYIRLARLYGLSAEEDAPEAVPPGNGSAAPGRLRNMALSEVRIPPEAPGPLQTVDSLADLIDSVVVVPSENGSASGAVRSPVNTEAPDFAEKMAVVEEFLTTEESSVLVGRINVHLASEIVLRALTGDASAAARIVEQRRLLSDSERESTAWLVARNVVDMGTYRRIFPHITTRGAVYSGEIVVCRRIGGPFLRRRVTIDASVHPARRIYWVDLTGQGMPLDVGVLTGGDADAGVGQDGTLPDESLSSPVFPEEL